MKLSNLYHLNDAEIAQLYKELTINFFEDDLYRTVFPSKSARQTALPYFFRHYIKAIRPNCYIVADSKECNCVMVVYDSSIDTTSSYYMRLVWMNMKMLIMMIRLHSFSSMHHILDCLDMFTSRWTKEFVNKESFHVDLLYTKETARHQGYATTLLTEVKKEAYKEGFDITMETHHEENLELYSTIGFKLMSEITHEEYALKQYCLLLRYEQENIE